MSYYQYFFLIDHFKDFTGFGEHSAEHSLFLPYSQNNTLGIIDISHSFKCGNDKRYFM